MNLGRLRDEHPRACFVGNIAPPARVCHPPKEELQHPETQENLRYTQLNVARSLLLPHKDPTIPSDRQLQLRHTPQQSCALQAVDSARKGKQGYLGLLTWRSAW